MKNSILFILFISVSLSFVKKSKTSTPEEFAGTLFSIIKQNDEKALVDLFLTNKEISETIDESSMEKEVAASFKEEFIEKLNKDREKTIEKLKDGFSKIRADIESKECENNIKLGAITPKVATLRNLPLEMGELDFEYICTTDTQLVSIAVINTNKGWRILEKIRLVD